MNPNLKPDEKKEEEKTPLAYKCTSDGKTWVMFKNKRCRYCLPIFDESEVESLKSKPQKTISFDHDIYHFIEKNRDRIKFSDYVNQLLSDMIKQTPKGHLGSLAAEWCEKIER